MAPSGQQEPPELNLGRAGGKAVLETLGASQAQPPVSQPPSGRDAAFQEDSEGVGAGEAHAAKQLPDTALTLCVLIGLGQAGLCMGWRGTCETMRR